MSLAKTPAKILIVDDEPAIRNLIHRFLSKDYQMESAEDGKTAIAKFEQLNPDLVILDINLPDTNGFDLCKEMRDRSNVFVLMLTSRKDEIDEVKCFNLGAGDFVTKPFGIFALEARVKTILNRREKNPCQPVKQNLEFGELKIDPIKREVTLNEDLVPFTALEFDLLHFLATHPNRVWTKPELLQQLWGYDHVADEKGRRLVAVHISNIRKKIGNKRSLIKTVQGVGYKFIPDQGISEKTQEEQNQTNRT
jgi:DNA-binding response OmpR family regulator